MTDPVFSSRYGQRPLIDVPALQVFSGPQLAITSLQKPIPVYQPPPAAPQLHAQQVVPRPYHTAPAPDPFHYHHYDPNSRTRQFVGPNGELVKPLETYFDTKYHYPGLYYPPPPPRPPTPPVVVVESPLPPPPPHPRQVPVMYPLPPQIPHYHVHPPSYSRQNPQEFDVNCDLEYGRVVRVSVRESRGHFRGIPEYLRRELEKGYSRYPFIQVKIKSSYSGDVHIYANHKGARKRKQRYEYEDDPFYDDAQDDDDYWTTIKANSDRDTIR